MEPVKKDEILYVQADGSMLQTRNDGWKEVKVGRIFRSGSCIDPNGKQNWIRHAIAIGSQYVAHFGSSKAFTAQMDYLIETYGRLDDRLVFISDGGTWIKNWIDYAFTEAISILNYYHACQHLHEFADIVSKIKKSLKNGRINKKNCCFKAK